MLDQNRAIPASRLRCKLFGPLSLDLLERTMEMWLIDNAQCRVVTTQTHLASGEPAEVGSVRMTAAIWYVDEMPGSDVAAAEAAADVLAEAEEVIEGALHAGDSGPRPGGTTGGGRP
ncbi:MAG: hypothetical protein HY329_25630 [Chloroflexi bacterium]|nr:hypothetical protein [Chloroflexota bacterium]